MPCKRPDALPATSCERRRAAQLPAAPRWLLFLARASVAPATCAANDTANGRPAVGQLALRSAERVGPSLITPSSSIARIDSREARATFHLPTGPTPNEKWSRSLEDDRSITLREAPPARPGSRSQSDSTSRGASQSSSDRLAATSAGDVIRPVSTCRGQLLPAAAARERTSLRRPPRACSKPTRTSGNRKERCRAQSWPQHGTSRQLVELPFLSSESRNANGSGKSIELDKASHRRFIPL